MTTAAMTVRRRTGAEAMMVVVPINLEGIAVNMVVVMIMARVGWNTNLCGALKGSGEEDGTSLGREEDQGGPRRTMEDHGRPSLPQVASLPPYHLPWAPMALTRSIHPAIKDKGIDKNTITKTFASQGWSLALPPGWRGPCLEVTVTLGSLLVIHSVYRGV